MKKALFLGASLLVAPLTFGGLLATTRPVLAQNAPLPPEIEDPQILMAR